MNECIIKIKNIIRVYGSKDNKNFALNNVSLNIEKGEMIAIMGPSGSGKSTLLNILGCIDVPTSGEYNLNNISVMTLNKTELAKVRNENIGFVFQNFALLNDYSIYENVELPLIYRNKIGNKKLSKKEIKEKSLSMLEKTGVISQEQKFPPELSGGQQQRVAIARALVGDTDIILADEPTGALDQKTGESIIELLKKINETGKTVIIVTHDINIAKKCKRLIELKDGNIIRDENISGL